MPRQEKKREPHTLWERGLVALLGSLLAAWVGGCSSSYCGAPCDPAPRPLAVQTARHAAVVNQYGSVFGYIEVDSMTRSQLQAEKTSLELLLGEEAKDAEILKALKERDDSAFDFAYDDYSTGGSRFNAKGKLRRDTSVNSPERRIPRMIGESQNRELFDRYRRVRLQIPRLEKRLALMPPPAPDTVRPPPPPPDTLWSGFFRIDGDTAVPASLRFRDLRDCQAWGREQGGLYRKKAFAFEYECRENDERAKEKIW